MSKGKRTFVIVEKPPNLEKELLKIEKKKLQRFYNISVSYYYSEY